MALQNGVIGFLLQDPFYPVQISHSTTTKAPPDHHIASTMLGRWHQALLKHLFFFLCLKNVLLCDPNNSNLDLSVHNTFFRSSSSQCLCSFAHLNIFFLLASLRYGFFFATLPRRPHSRVISSLLTFRLVFCGYYLMKLPVEDL